MFESEEMAVHRVKTVLNAVVHSETSLPTVGKQRSLPGSEVVDQDAKWKRLFCKYDADHGDTLCFKEFKKLIRGALHITESKLPDKDLRLLFERIDCDGSGEIEYGEFAKYVKLGAKESEELPRTLGRALRLALTRLKIRTEAELREIIDSLDFDASGGITLHQFRRLIREVLRLSKQEFSDYYVKRLMTNIDADNDGEIGSAEFVRFVKDHVNLGGISNTGCAGPGAIKSYVASEVTSQISLVKTSSCLGLNGTIERQSADQPKRRSPSVGSRRTSIVAASGEKGKTVAGIRPSGRRPAPYTGDERPRGYFILPGADCLNKVEGRLFSAGFDIRGEFFKVADGTGEVTTGGGRRRDRPARLGGFASAPALTLPPLAKESPAGRSSGLRDPGLRTMYLREVAKGIL